MDYVDWVERVLHAAASAVGESHDARVTGVSVWEVARRLDLGIDPISSEFHESDQRMAVIHAVDDLRPLGLAVGLTETGNYFTVQLTDEGRRAAATPLRASWWPAMFQHFRIDD